MKKTVIIGAGPAGLAAGHRLSENRVETVILEQEAHVGGISRTVRYKGYGFDIGGHRFYTKNKQVLDWWRGLLKDDFLSIPRQSRIYYRDIFLKYPISIPDVIARMGFFHSLIIVLSFLYSRLSARREQETTFSDWVSNRFGRKLYDIFFKDYTEKVWGLSGEQLSADVAGQRIPGMSLPVALRNALLANRGHAVASLISEFYYPRLGAGMMYEAAASEFSRQGGQLQLNHEVLRVRHAQRRITSVVCQDRLTGTVVEHQGSDYCSSMPITDLLWRLDPLPDRQLLEMCGKLRYRSLILVYVIVKKKDLVRDNWIYVHSQEVKVARIQNFRQWSPALLADAHTSSLGMEYFCDEADDFWSQSDAALIALAGRELETIKLARPAQIQDALVVRVPKAYPVYALGYERILAELKCYLSGFANLQSIGRFGMFHYNSMDHSVLTGLLAAENILGAGHDLWQVKPGEAYAV
ncbi:MAG TPA: NAD(P)-binding protein [Candidatus Omnitrophota bacterium]|nr:NAD(P)-binding protein [Candidatus Omnitrophota bacterium]HRZ14432.1 NAD(P)-binding protein [Candidatus Omnitrophota bacterium]